MKTLSTAMVDGEPNLERLGAVAEALIVAAKAGDVSAIKEIGDRLEGRPSQTLDIDITQRNINITIDLYGSGLTPQPACEAEDGVPLISN